MEIIISVIVAYMLSGISHALNSFKGNPYERPKMLRTRPLVYVVCVTFFWPLLLIFKNYYSLRMLGRSIAYGLMSSILQIAWISGLVWGCLAIATTLSDAVYMQIITTIGLAYAISLIASPIAAILLTPIMLFFSLIIDLIFPLKDNNKGASVDEQ